MIEQRRGFACDPRAQHWKSNNRRCSQCSKFVGVGLPVNNAKRILHGRKYQFGRQTVAAELPRIDVLPLDVKTCAGLGATPLRST